MADLNPREENEYIAVIGMACRFPGADNLEEFWNNLLSGTETISFFSGEELREAGIHPGKLSQPNYVRAKGIIKDSQYFDARFFGFTPREAEVLDPQHRAFLECAWHTFENAGYIPEKVKGRVGVFGGTGATWHLHNLINNPAVAQFASGLSIVTGNEKDYLTTRISYKLNLNGPSVNVQSACSTSLVAVILGIYSLLSYQTDMVLAGGVSIDIPEKSGYLFQEGGIESPDGHCRAFDSKAKGTVFSRGVGTVLIKRLSDALAEGDHIYSVIKGGAINNDGALKAGYTTPSVTGQEEVITEALTMAGFSPETFNYYEAHGTGTQVGDPIEIAALTKTFRHYTGKKGFCAVGSVKNNIGHTDIAAGAAGLIKTSLILKNRRIPPTINFTSPNPEIDFENSPFFVNTETIQPQANPLRAGVSSFGVGGTNACVVLEEAPPRKTDTTRHPRLFFPLSAQTEKALYTMVSELKKHLKNNPDLNLADTAYTLQTGRKRFAYRSFFVAGTRDEALSIPDKQDHSELPVICSTDQNQSLLFMFPGQGNQYINMGLDLYHNIPLFKKEVDHCCRLLEPELGFDLRTILFPASGQTKSADAVRTLNRTSNAQPALFVIQYALARTWIDWGIKPSAMIGHSVGEYTAACLAGVFSLEDALMVVATRGRLVQKMPPGSMLAILHPEEEIRSLLPPHLSVAAVNSPRVVVVSGPTPLISDLGETLAAKKIHFKHLATSHAFHSEMMEPVLAPLSQVLKQIPLHPPQIPFVSTVTGKWITPAETTNPGYWAQHVRKTVRFSEAVEFLLHETPHIFFEVGPGRSLQSAVKNRTNIDASAVIGSMPGQEDSGKDTKYLYTALGRLWAAGVDIPWSDYYRKEKRFRVPLPGYPFQRELFSAVSSGQDARGVEENLKQTDTGEWFYIPVWSRTAPAEFLPREPEATDSFWLIFTDRLGLGQHIIANLQAEGKKVLRIIPGTGFNRTEEDLTINPGNPADYDELCREIKETGKGTLKIVHLWNVTGSGDEPVNWHNLGEKETLAFYSLLYLSQALIKYNFLEKLHLTVVTDGVFDITGEKVCHPEKALCHGPCRVFRQEYPVLWSRAADILFPPSFAQRKELAASLIMETTVCTEETIVAYRGSHRWSQTFTPLSFITGKKGSPCLRDNGVYLITGGLGGMGLEIAKYLAETVHARLVLTYRSPLPPRPRWEEWLNTHSPGNPVSRKILGIRELESAGGKVFLYRVDITDYLAMGKLEQEISHTTGEVNGVFHAAGNAGGGIIPLKTDEMAASVLAPKVKGTLVLMEILKNSSPDFIILFSSITSILGETGRVDYCAANSFLDSYAHSLNRGKELMVTALNWGTWGKVGMAVRQREEESGLSDSWKPIPETETTASFACLGRHERETIYQMNLEPGQDWVMSEHRISGIPTLVGTAYLSLARDIADSTANSFPMTFRNIYFMAPYMYNPPEVRNLRFYHTEKGEHEGFVFKSRTLGGESGSEQEHVVGEMSFESPREPCHQDISRLLNRFHTEPDRTPFTGLSADKKNVPLFYFGERWDCLREVYCGENEWLARLELPDNFSDDLKKYPLHPAMLDVATVFALRYLTQDFYLPLGYKEIIFHAPLEKRIYVYTRLRESQNTRSRQEVLSFDVQIFDSLGTELVTIQGYTLKTVPENFLSSHGKKRSSLSENRENRKVKLQKPDDILPEEGIQALEKYLENPGLAQLIIVPRDFPRMLEENLPSSRKKIKEKEQKNSPPPVYSRPHLSTPYTAPANEIEKTIVEIWQSVLGIKQVGIHDNFMELGGNSLLAIQTMANTADSFQVDLSIEDFLSQPTVAGIGGVIINKLSALFEDENLEQMLLEIESAPEKIDISKQEK